MACVVLHNIAVEVNDFFDVDAYITPPLRNNNCETAAMTPDSFEELHNLIKPCITKQDKRFRDAISSKERLGLTLR
ncbi:unnamed protein product [Parnassius mnemosyne]|uniref:Nuclease HARBI1 n=1 Tax=Parnassius mnemosyne TaxID=213953 RepID=A0AAV1LAU0_9NEOP